MAGPAAETRASRGEYLACRWAGRLHEDWGEMVENELVTENNGEDLLRGH